MSLGRSSIERHVQNYFPEPTFGRSGEINANDQSGYRLIGYDVMHNGLQSLLTTAICCPGALHTLQKQEIEVVNAD